MKIGLVGYGAMGRLVGELAKARGHQISVTIDIDQADQSVAQLADLLKSCEVAIDFSIGDAVPTHAEACVRAGVPLVVGTTGWQTELQTVRRLVEENQGALIYGANFSVGVQVFYRIAERAADLFRNLDSHDPFIEEAHHKRKRDAPSGTALHLHKLVSDKLDCEVPVTSTRAGFMPGTHRLGFDSAADQVTLTHTARSREGFAAGALLAAQWIRGRKGFYEFSQVFDEIIRSPGPKSSNG